MSEKQASLQAQLKVIFPTAGINKDETFSHSDHPVVSDESVRAIDTKGDILTPDEKERLIRFLGDDDYSQVPSWKQEVASHEKKVMQEAQAIMQRLQENGGNPLKLHTLDGLTEVEVWYDETEGTFFRKYLVGGGNNYAQSFPQPEKFFNFLKHNEFIPDVYDNHRQNQEQKIVFDPHGNHVKVEEPAREAVALQNADTDSEASVISVDKNIALVETDEKAPVNNPSQEDVVLTGELLPREKKVLTDAEKASAIEQELADAQWSAKKEVTPLSVEVIKNVTPKTQESDAGVVSQKEADFPVNDTSKTLKDEKIHEKEILTEETDSFTPKSAEMRNFLESKHFSRYKGAHRTDKEMAELADDIRHAAQRVVAGEDIATVIASLGLGDINKISKTLKKDIPDILAAEFAAHQAQQNPDTVVQPLPRAAADEKKNISDDSIALVSPEDILKSDATKQLPLQEGGRETPTEAKEVLVQQQNEIVLNERLFGKIRSEEEQKRFDEGNAHVEALRVAMATARQGYAQMDYKKTGMMDSVKRFFGESVFKSLAKDEDHDVIEAQAWYLNAVMNYKNARLEQVREQSATQEALKMGLVEVLREIEMQERVHLYDARVNAKIPNWLLEKTQKTVDWYRELSFEKKLMFSGAMILGGAAVIRQVFGGMVAGRGVFQLTETLSQKSSQKEMDANIRDTQKEIAFAENTDDMIQQVHARLDESIGIVYNQSTVDFSDRLNTMMKSRTRNTVAGFAAGAFLSFGAPQYLMEKFQASFGGGDVVHAAASHAEKVINVPELPHEALEVAPVKIVELTMHTGTGQSIEGQLIHHLVTSGHEKVEAGKMAHRMVLDYVHEHGGNIKVLDKILSGKVAFDPDSLHIKSIDAIPLRSVATHAVDVHSKVMESTVQLASQIQEVPSVSALDSSVAHVASSLPSDVFGNTAVVEKSADVLTHAASEAAPTVNMYTSALEASPAEIGDFVRRAAAKGLMGELAGGKQSMWLEIKNVTMAQMQTDQSGHYARVLGVIAKHTKELGSNMPKVSPDKTLLQWVAEVAKASAK